MVTAEKTKQIVEIVRKIGRVQKNQLIRYAVDKGFMSHFTASKAIDDAVKSHRIFRQVEHRGNLKIVFLSINENIQKAEDCFKQEVESSLNRFDEQFLIFKKRYRDLSNDEKADGLDVFKKSMVNIMKIVGFLIEAYEKTRYWTSLYKELESRQLKFRELSHTESEEDIISISQMILSHHFEDLRDSVEDVESFLNSNHK